jgi:hypothetical protein
MTNQPTPTRFKESDRVIEEVHNPESALTDADAGVTALEELRRKLCDRSTVPQKSKRWFW